MDRRRVVALSVTGVLALGVVGAVAGPGVAADLLHPRDVDGFRSYLDTYVVDVDLPADLPDGDLASRAAVADHPDAVLAEGDRACRWLHARPDAPAADPTGRSRSSELALAYASAVPPQGLSLDPGIRQYVVFAAWDHLCWRDQHDKTSPRTTGD